MSKSTPIMYEKDSIHLNSEDMMARLFGRAYEFWDYDSRSDVTISYNRILPGWEEYVTADGRSSAEYDKRGGDTFIRGEL